MDNDSDRSRRESLSAASLSATSRMNLSDFEELDSYSSFEQRYLGATKRIVCFLLYPFARLAVALRISPNTISLLQIPVAIATWYTNKNEPRLSALFLCLTMFLDGLDGVLAKVAGNSSLFGKVIDQFSDHAKDTLIFAGLVLAQIVDPVWALLYVVAHIVFNLVIYGCNYFEVPVAFALKPSLVVYPLIFLRLWWKGCMQLARLLDLSLIVATCLMTLVIIQGLRRLENAMRDV